MKKILLFITLLFLLSLVRAQDTTYISLENLLQRVETNYPSIIAYRYNIQSIQAKAEGAKAWMPPTFSTGVMRWPYNLMMLNEKMTP